MQQVVEPGGAAVRLAKLITVGTIDPADELLHPVVLRHDAELGDGVPAVRLRTERPLRERPSFEDVAPSART